MSIELTTNKNECINFLNQLVEHPLVGLPYIHKIFDIKDNDVIDSAKWLLRRWKNQGIKLPKDLKKYL